MIEIRGAYNTALCYATVLEASAEQQIRAVCDRPEFADCRIRIMPDVHAGKGCTIGTTMTIRDRIVPGMVGVDIGCGMETVELAERDIDFAALDALIRAEIPCGRRVRDKVHPLAAELDLNELCCGRDVDRTRGKHSIGTLGGGNHFIEVDRGEDGRLFLVVHSGSRHLGTEVANYYQSRARRALKGVPTPLGAPELPPELTYVEGALFNDYLHDMRLTQRFAALNRRAMVEVILSGMGWTPVDAFTTIHNYVDTEHMILRKGSVSARAGEKLLIPINMRDGSLICRGRGNEDWNCSAPHGAGRLLSRKAAFDTLSMEEFRREMAGVYTTCVLPDTLDESPMAYKSLSDILDNIGPTAEVTARIRPVYNFKSPD